MALRTYTIRISIGIFCFLIHAAIIFSHTYFIASHKGRTPPPPPHRFARVVPHGWHAYLDLNRWDSGHYEAIVRNGYRDPDNPSEPRHQIQWYPGYPLIVGLVRKMTGGKISFVMSLLSAILTAGFWILLWFPGAGNPFQNRVLTATSALIICYPGAYYWFAGMTEPLVGLLALTCLRLWLSGRLNLLTGALALATGVKQVFLPLAIAFSTLQWVKSRPRFWPWAGRAVTSAAGFIVFGLYSWWCFGDFFTSSNMAIEVYKKKISLLNIVDLPHFAANIFRPSGFVAFFSMLFLLHVGLGLFRFQGGIEALRRRVKEPWGNVTPEGGLWWTALAYTTFCVMGDAYGAWPFLSFLRYQSANIFLFFLLALHIKDWPLWRLAAFLIPLCWVSLWWQRALTVQYWAWKWVA